MLFRSTATVEVKAGQTGINDLQVGVPTADVRMGQAQVAVFATPHDGQGAGELNVTGDSGTRVQNLQTDRCRLSACSGEVLPLCVVGHASIHRFVGSTVPPLSFACRVAMLDARVAVVSRTQHPILSDDRARCMVESEEFHRSIPWAMIDSG